MIDYFLPLPKTSSPSAANGKEKYEATAASALVISISNAHDLKDYSTQKGYKGLINFVILRIF